MKDKASAQAMATNGKTKAFITPPPGKFQNQNYAFASAQNSDHEGVVRIPVSHSL